MGPVQPGPADGDLDLAHAAAHQNILKKEKVNTGAEKSLNRLSRSVDDRLALDVEARIEHHLPARGLSYRLQQRVELLVVFGGDSLYSG